VAEDMSIELVIIVGQRKRGRVKRKHIREFKLLRMTFKQYNTAADMIVASVMVLGQSFIDRGFTIEFMGDTITKDDVLNADKA
jgi:hypothetical protein